MACHQSKGWIVFVLKCMYFNDGTTIFSLTPHLSQQTVLLELNFYFARLAGKRLPGSA